MARPLGEDPATDPVIDARLADGSCVGVCSPPRADDGDYDPPLRRPGLHHRRADRERLAFGAVGRGGGGRAQERTQRPDLRRHWLGEDDAAECSGVAAAGRGPRHLDRGHAGAGLRRANGRRFEARGLVGRGRDDPRPGAARPAPPARPHRGRRGARRRGGRPAPGTEHGARRQPGDGPRQQRDGGAVTLGDLSHAASGELPWAVVCRVVDGIEAVIHQIRTPEGACHVEQMVRVPGLRRGREPQPSTKPSVRRRRRSGRRGR